MTEDPIKLFASRAERYPEPTEADAAQGAVRVALAAVPVLGGSLTEILSMVLTPALTRRRDDWFKELAEAFESVETKVNGFTTGDLQGNELFVSAAIQATRAAISTHQEEKRAALRNALVNIALGRAPQEDQVQMFLRYVEELTTWHLRVLRFFQSPANHLAAKGLRSEYMMGGGAQVLEDMYPELRGNREFYDQIATDLHSRGMLNSPPSFLHTSMTGSGMVAKRTTAIADAFLAFITSPI
jgi:hypothetical protein